MDNLDFDLHGMTEASFMFHVCGNYVRLASKEEGWNVKSFSNEVRINIDHPDCDNISNLHYGQFQKMSDGKYYYWYGYNIKTIPVNGSNKYFLPMIHNDIRINKNKVMHELRLEYKKKENEKMWNILIHLHARGGRSNSTGLSVPIEIGHHIWKYVKNE